MPLDPEAKAMLETLSGGEEVDPFALPHTLVREGFAAMSGLSEGPEVAKVEMRRADGPAGSIAVRVYSPASPLRARDLSGLPSATILAAEYDPLRDEGHAYAKRLKEAGVATTHTDYPGVFHGFFGMTAQIPRARQAVDESCAALRKAFRV